MFGELRTVVSKITYEDGQLFELAKLAKLRFNEDFQIRIRCLTGEGVLLKMSSHDFIRKIMVHSGVKSQVLQTVKSKLEDFLFKPLVRFQ